MIDLVITVMFSTLSLAQTGQAAITTNELAPPPGMTSTAAPIASPKAAPPAKNAQAPSKETPSDTPAANKQNAVPENAVSAEGSAASPPAPTGAQSAQPTTEEKQAPTQAQAGGSGRSGRIAAFWFILPNRPTGNK